MEPLPPTLEHLVPELHAAIGSALADDPASLFALGVVSHGFCDTLLGGEHAHQLWVEVSRRTLGPAAPEMARRAGAAAGLAGYRAARRLRAEVAAGFEVVEGSVTEHLAGADAVACPCLGSLRNYGLGAQGAVRRAAGASFEHGLRSLRLPLAPLSATLVEGGALAPMAVAMVVTTPPREVLDLLDEMHISGDVGSAEHASRVEALGASLSQRLHASLFGELRAAGLWSVAMPTLATGGTGLSAPCVCAGLATARRSLQIAPQRREPPPDHEGGAPAAGVGGGTGGRRTTLGGASLPLRWSSRPLRWSSRPLTGGSALAAGAARGRAPAAGLSAAAAARRLLRALARPPGACGARERAASLV